MAERDLKAKFARWVDEWKLALAGVGLALKSWKFVVLALVIFWLFATFLNMLSLPASFTYLFNLPFSQKPPYLGQMLLGVFGYQKDSILEWLPILIIAILQALLIAMVVLVWRKKRAMKAATMNNGGTNAGIVTGLAVLAGGCPSCGTSLLMPVLGALFSGSSAVVGNVLSWGLTLVAIIVALLSFKKVGLDAYVIMVSERRRKSRDEQAGSSRK